MKFKIFNYLAQYFNNIKSLNSIFSKLRIQFERASKIMTLVNNLGNVFRNSK